MPSSVAPAPLLWYPSADSERSRRARWGLRWAARWEEFLSALPAHSSRLDFSFAQELLRRALSRSISPGIFPHMAAGSFLPAAIPLSPEERTSLSGFWLWSEPICLLRNEIWLESAPSASSLTSWIDGALRHPEAPWLRWGAFAPSADGLVPALLEAGVRDIALPRWGALPIHALCSPEWRSRPLPEWIALAAPLCSPASFFDDAEAAAEVSRSLPRGRSCPSILSERWASEPPLLPWADSDWACRSLGELFWMEWAGSLGASSLDSAAATPYARATLSPAAAGLSREAAANWPLGAGIGEVPYCSDSPVVAKLLRAGADPNALGTQGLRMWQIAAEPLFETGSEGFFTILTEEAFAFWFEAGADFSLPYQGKPLSSVWRSALRPADAADFAAAAQKWEAMSRARSDRSLLEASAAPADERHSRKSL